jgi:hypothetical protein
VWSGSLVIIFGSCMMMKSSGYRKMCDKSNVGLKKLKVFVEGSYPGGYDKDSFVRPSFDVPRSWKFFCRSFSRAVFLIEVLKGPIG